MKTPLKITLLGLLILALIFGGFALIKKKNRTIKKQHRHTTQTTPIEKPFVIIIPSYNNANFCEKNLTSVLTQHYDNYRVIYIDDHSTDTTCDLVENLLPRLDTKKRVTLIKNAQNRGSLANYYFAIHSCQSDEIVVALDGDDFLAHENVLQTLNHTYADPMVWMTYGNFLDYPSYKQDPVSCEPLSERVIQNNTIRKHPWVTSHVRTFYAALFHHIKLEYLLFQGDFFPMAGDLAYTMPLIEMAGTHVRFIPETLYLYNRTNPINDHKKNLALQNTCAASVRAMRPYAPLKTLSSTQDNEQVDVVVFSYDRPLQLYAFLESFSRFASGYNRLCVIYRSSSSEYEQSYQEVKEHFPLAHFLKQTEKEDFSPLVRSLMQGEAAYITFAVDDLIVKDEIDFHACVAALQCTGAYGFYLANGLHLNFCYMQNCQQPLPHLIDLGSDTFAWQFEGGQADWKYPNSVDLVVYRKQDIRKDFEKIAFHNPSTLESQWALRAKHHRVGLCYSHSKAVNIPLNIVSPSNNRHLNAYSTQELLTLFQNGLKIDITPFTGTLNASKHSDSPLNFTRKY